MTKPDKPGAALEAKQRVELGLEALRRGLAPYVAKHMRDRYGDRWPSRARRAQGGDANENLDVYALLSTLLDHDRWNELFRYDERLRKARSFVFLARDARNRVAHFSGELSGREALRYLDAMRELSAAVGAREHAEVIEKIYEEQRAADSARPGPCSGTPTGEEVVRDEGEFSRSHGQRAHVTSREPLRNRAGYGKYEPLFRRLAVLEHAEWQASFGEIEAILGFSLPASARRHQAWWANQKGGSGHSHARAWQGAGWRTRDVNLVAETVVFECA